jgi:biotin carboxyl carrier protein
VDVTPVNGAISLILDDGKSYEVSIAEQPAGSGNLTVHVNGRVVSAVVGTSRGSWAKRGLEGSASGRGPQQVIAPMPGKVVKLLVKPGDQVAAKQGVVVVEAMKMENELRSPKAGTVIEVKIAEGASVEAGAVLVVIE